MPRRRRIYVRQDKYSKKPRAEAKFTLIMPRRKRIYVRQDKYEIFHETEKILTLQKMGPGFCTHWTVFLILILNTCYCT